MFKKINEWLAEKNISKAQFEEMQAEEMADLYNEYNDYVNSEMEKAIKSNASKEDLEAIKSEITKNTNDQMIALNKALKDQGLVIKRLAENMPTANKKSNSIKEALIANKENLSTLKDSRNGEFGFTTKATMTLANNVSGGNVPVEDRIEGLNVIPTRRVTMTEVATQRSTTANVVSWVYQANKTGTTGATAEGGVKNNIDFELVVESLPVKKITNFIKVSDEMITDITWMEQEIRDELLRELALSVENEFYQGSGIGENISGLVTQATAFSPTASFATNVENPNVVDLMVAAADQIEIANQDVVRPYIFLNPSVVNKLMTEKVTATDRRYVDRLTRVGTTLMLDGTWPIIKSTLISGDNFLIGDFSKAIFVTREGVDIQIGLDADDFTKNLRTIRAEWRGLAIIKNNHRTAFVEGTIAAGITAITKV